MHLSFQMAQEVNQLCGLDRIGTEPEIEAPARDPGRRRKLLPSAGMPKNGRWAARGPGARHIRPLAQAAFVEKDEGAPVPTGFF